MEKHAQYLKTQWIEKSNIREELQTKYSDSSVKLARTEEQLNYSREKIEELKNLLEKEEKEMITVRNDMSLKQIKHKESKEHS